ncbi:FAD-binding oxidoreductase [Actinomadura syzygii]|uniref:FAD-binding oxidoreductase n=1 Tax=Actinomadura syzygii TaxID=1427538 RepID=A0A5D0UI98_9ACTN|nr:FAD-binding oxidoreductase [Actinomadura syzygii]TYC17774.1 FAD-binding oxidoreductase [Actinomadura syzygii]
MSPPDLDGLREQVSGPVLAPGHPGLDGEVATFNLTVRHRPAVVVGATGAADVAAAVGFARRNGLPVAVHATGHGSAAPVEGALVVNTSRMRGLTVDAAARTARVEAGVRWAEVVEATAPFGLAPLCGSAPAVGAVGYTLGGGCGPVARTYGFAADHVRSLEVVTADGRTLTADADIEPDLFWALRGGKGDFGIVTAMTIDLFPIAMLYGGGIFYPGEHSAQVLHAYREWSRDLPESITTSVALLRLPPVEELPPPLRGRFVVHLRVAHVGDQAEGERLLAPMRSAAPAIIDMVGMMPYTAIGAIHNDPTDPMPYWEGGGLFRELTEGAVQALLDAAGPGAEAPPHVVEVRQLGGAMARAPRVPNAVGGRDAAYSLLVLAPPPPQDMAGLVRPLGERVLDAVRPWTTGGALLNFQGAATAPAQVAGAWPPDVHLRLMELKAVYDPAGMFRFGHSIGVPDSAAG